jgi:hypothetical protein
MYHITILSSIAPALAQLFQSTVFWVVMSCSLGKAWLLEEHIYSTFVAWVSQTTKEQKHVTCWCHASLHFWSWRRVRWVPLKFQSYSELHDFTTQTTILFVVTAGRTSNPKQLLKVPVGLSGTGTRWPYMTSHSYTPEFYFLGYHIV